METLVRGKEQELEQAAEAYRNLQWLKQQSEEKEKNTLREKDVTISQLQAALRTRSQEIQVLHPHTIVMASNCSLSCCFVKSSSCRQTNATCLYRCNRNANTTFARIL